MTSEVKVVCVNCGFFTVIGYYNDLNFMWVNPTIPDNIYDGVCPKCSSDLITKILDLEEEKTSEVRSI